MGKRVLILSSSPRKGGNSDLLCDEFLHGAVEAGNEGEKICLQDKKIQYCTGCGVCSEQGLPCPQKDDMPEILNKMIQADVIVMATPVYFYTMSAQMKTLIDRTCSRYTEITGKDFYFIVTAADEDAKEMERTLEGFRGFTYCLEDAKEKGVIAGVGVWKKGDIVGKEFLNQAYETGRLVGKR